MKNFFAKFSITLLFSLSLFACAVSDSANSNKELNSFTEYSPDAARAVNKLGQTDEAKEVKSKLICTTEIQTGSRFSKRVCRTQKELSEYRQQNREQLDPERTEAREQQLHLLKPVILNIPSSRGN